MYFVSIKHIAITAINTYFMKTCK